MVYHFGLIPRASMREPIMNGMHKAVTAMPALIIAIACHGDTLEQEIRALRPSDTAAGEKAVLDNLQGRARTALAGLKHPTTPQQAGIVRKTLRQKLDQSLGIGLLPWPPNLQPRAVGTIARDGYRIEKIVFETLPG